MICTVNDIDYVLERHGGPESAPALLMLHGFMGCGACFGHLAGGLSEFCRPITVDLLGHGRTGGAAQPERYEVSRQINDLRKLVARLGMDPLYLHGYSMGGRLALQYALEYPETLGGLVLESTHPGIEDPEKRKSRREADESRAAAVESGFDAFLDEWEKKELFSSPSHDEPDAEEAAADGIGSGTGRESTEDRFTRYLNLQREQSPERMAASLRGFGTGSMSPAWDRLAGLGLPVLVIAGQGDRKYCELSARLNTMLSHNRVEIVPGAGHRVHLDQPYHFIKILKSFLTHTERHEH